MHENNKKYYTNLAITLLLILGALSLPGIGPLTEYGTKVVVIFIGVIFGYSTLGMVIPSFLALLALGFTEYGTVATVLKNALGNETVLYVFSILIIAQLLSECQLTVKMINWIVTRKIAKGRPWILSFLLMVTAYVAAFFVNAIVPTIILWALVFDLCSQVGFHPGDKWPMVMVFGILYAASIGSFVAPFQIGVVSNFGMLSTASGGLFSLSYSNYFIWAFIIGSILLVEWFLFARYVINPDVEALKRGDLFQADMTPFTKEQRIVVVIVGLFIVGLFLPSLLPEGNIIRIFLERLGNCGWGLVMVLIAVLVRVNGKNVYAFEELFNKSVIWDITLMMACVFTMAGALVDPATGVSNVVIHWTQPLLGMMGPNWFLVVMIAVVIVSANLTNTVAVCCIFIPIMYSVTVGGGSAINIVLFTACMNFVCGFCFLSPACSPNAAMMYEKKEWIPIRYAIFFALFSLISTYIVVIGIGLPLGELLF